MVCVSHNIEQMLRYYINKATWKRRPIFYYLDRVGNNLVY